MSRVRFLNLPKDCSDASLRQHILKGLPTSGSPAVEITDCSVKRSADGALVRMAFVGFRTAAAGQFIVKHFNGTYFRNCKLRVESATGLNDTATSTNLKKKILSGRASELPSYIKVDDRVRAMVSASSSSATRMGVSGAAAIVGHSVAEEGGERTAASRTGKRQREEPTEDEHHATVEELEARRNAQRQQFVESRVTNSAHPSWAGELLLPEGDLVKHESEVEGVVENDFDHAERQQEQNAIDRQQVLGAVSDVDFLASLGQAPPQNVDTGASTRKERKSTGASESTTLPSTAGTTALDGCASGEARSARGPSAEPSSRTESDLDLLHASRRLLLKGVPFVATESDVKNFVTSTIGPVDEVHIPLTKDSKQSKGCAFVRFTTEDDAVRCFETLQGAVFMGRLVRCVPVADDPYTAKAAARAASAAVAPSSGGGIMTDVKAKKAEAKRAVDATGISLNTAYVNTHTAVEATAKKLGVAAKDIVSVESKGGAVRAAIAEAFLTSELRMVLGDEGIDTDVLNAAATQSGLKARSNVTILVKNLPPSADLSLLSKLFLKFGSLEATAIPSSGAFALFRFVHPQDARIAFQRLAYKPFGSQPLFLEWAPVGCFRELDEADSSSAAPEGGGGDAASALPESSTGALSTTDVNESLAVKTQQLTLYVTNLPLRISEEDWREFLNDCCPRLVAAPGLLVRLTLQSNSGRSFLECKDSSTFKYVMSRIHGRKFNGRVLSCVASKATSSLSLGGAATMATSSTAHPRSGGVVNVEPESADDDHAASRLGGRLTGVIGGGGSVVSQGCDPLKLIVKNLPFEATEKDLRELFSAFTEVKAVRVPRKVTTFSSHRENNHRGFGFVEFLSEQEAVNAQRALSSTHLYGRHLVIQFAKLDS